MARADPTSRPRCGAPGRRTTRRGRAQGTVTNVGPDPIRRLQAHIAGPDATSGLARLSDVLNPGETRTVDEPILTIEIVRPGPSPVPPEDTVVFAAASLAISGPGQVAVAGVSGPKRPGGADGRSVGVVVTVVPLTTDSLFRGNGGAQLVPASPLSAAGSVDVADVEAPPGAGPLSIR